MSRFEEQITDRFKHNPIPFGILSTKDCEIFTCYIIHILIVEMKFFGLPPSFPKESNFFAACPAVGTPFSFPTRTVFMEI